MSAVAVAIWKYPALKSIPPCGGLSHTHYPCVTQKIHHPAAGRPCNRKLRPLNCPSRRPDKLITRYSRMHTFLLLQLGWQLLWVSQVSIFLCLQVIDPKAYNSFLNQCTIHFEVLAHQFDLERAKVAFIVSLLSGEALVWETPLWEHSDFDVQPIQVFLQYSIESLRNQTPL